MLENNLKTQNQKIEEIGREMRSKQMHNNNDNQVETMKRTIEQIRREMKENEVSLF